MAISSPSWSSVAALIDSGELRALYQPVVELSSGETVGYEALARGPVDTPLEMPAAIFEMARQEGLGPELDRACREVALAGALASGLGSSDFVFLNVEPGGLGEAGDLGRLGEDHGDDIAVVVELTERALVSRPAEVLNAVHWLRQSNCRIALDDVGVDRRSLALMPFLAPDVIKLDIGLTQDRLPPLDSARVLSAVSAEAERSGCIVLAEGIETPKHLERALGMGATLGQGWLFGRPGPIPPDAPRSKGRPDIPRHESLSRSDASPFERIADSRALRLGDQQLLVHMSRQLETEALAHGGEAVILASFEADRYFTPRTRRRYEKLARSAALVGAIAPGLDREPALGVRGADAVEGSSLPEWDVAVVSPQFAAAFVAREVGDGSGQGRQFEYFVTYDRELAIEAARPLLRRIVRSN